jgi:serine/threonine-protein kinase
LLGYVGDVKITDFGVARIEEDNHNPTDTLQGKVGYMSPEQIVGDPLDRRSDVFCCGIILYEMLTLKRLFAGNSELDVLLKVRDGDIGTELERLGDLPSDLQRIVRRALAQRPQDRYQTAAEFIDDLQDFAFTHKLKFTDQHLSRFLVRVFADDYKRLNHIRKSDPEDPSKFPDLLSPQVARFRFREPNGNIVGPMSVETLVSMLRYRKGAGLAVSVSYGPWLRPFETPEIQQAFLASQESDGARTASGSGAFAGNSGSQEVQVLERPSDNLAKIVGEHGAEAGDGAALSLQGDLVNIPFASLLYRLYAVRARGVLTVKSGDIEKGIHIDDGAPGFVATNRPTELLGNFLVEQRVIDGEQLEATLEVMSESGKRLGDVLIDQGLLNRNELFHYLSLQAREKLMEVFAWTSGEFLYRDGLSGNHESDPLGIDTLEIIVEGARARMPIETIRKVFAGRGAAPLRILQNRQVSLERLRLTGQELSIAAVFRNGDTIDEVLRLFATSRHASEEEILRVIFLLYSTRHVYFRSTDP